MAGKKVIAVLGATGAQGGGLVRAILADRHGPFTARAITRDVTSDKAKALSGAGAEVVAADVGDEASIVEAFRGAHGAFCVTFYWAHLSPERELAEAASMARAVKTAGISHAIWSTLEDTRRFMSLDDDRMPTLMGNFIYFGSGPRPGPDGTLALTYPMGSAKLPGIGAEDIGRSAHAIFKAGPRALDQTIGIAGDHLTMTQIAAAFTRALGRPVRYHEVEPEVYRGFGFPGADDLGNMFQFKRDFNDQYCAARDLAKARALNPAMQTLDQWLAQNAGRVPLD